MKRMILAAALMCAATPALAEQPSYRIEQSATAKAAMRTEYVFLGLSAIDAVETIAILGHCKDCVEGNPIIGKHPGVGKIVAFKLVGGAVHFYMVREITKKNPKLGLRIAQVSAFAQGAVIGLNARFVF